MLALPAGFSYVTFGHIASRMSDGHLTPLALDGMAAFRGPRGTVRLIRNHEDRNLPGEGSVPHDRRSYDHDRGRRDQHARLRPADAARSCATTSRSRAATSTARAATGCTAGAG